jgi:hypothetical protein
MLLARKGENAKSARVSRENAVDFWQRAFGFFEFLSACDAGSYISFKLQQEAKKTKP